jgi:3-deoxy-D-manno-octulosonic-acid transferase
MLNLVYKSAWRIATPFISKYLDKRAMRGKEDPERLSERYGIASEARPEGPLIWVHGASVGESLSALKLIENLLETNPHLSILITTGTVTSAALLGRNLPDRVIHQYIPLDHPKWVSSFLDHWQPDGMIWLESEIWPVIFRKAYKRNIPACLINGRLSEKSFRRWKRVKGFSRRAFSLFKLCLTQSAHDTDRFRQMGLTAARTFGNLKYTASPLPIDEDHLKALKRSLSKREICFFASTHKGEEKIAFRAFKTLKEHIPNLLFIIALRHPNRIREIESLAHQQSLSVKLHSENAEMKIGAETDIYLVDTIGEMGLFYSLSPITVIGGSFASKGGHNPIEPAHFDSSIVMGPRYFNFKDICNDFRNAKAMIFVEDEEELHHNLLELIADKESQTALQKNAKNLVLEKSHLLSKTTEEIVDCFNKYSQVLKLKTK